MTYGEVAADLRDSIGRLVANHRPRIGLGGPNGRRPATTSPALMRSHVELILRYRAAVWDYTRAALETAIPPLPGPEFRPVARLVRRVDAFRPDPASLPGGRRASGLELGSSLGLPLVETWRQAAAAAVAGTDRELPLIRYRLDPDERWLLVQDASELVHALLRLDDRYARLPGWRILGGRHAATHARPQWGTSEEIHPHGPYSTALLCERLAATRVGPDALRVDRLGHRARPARPVPPLEGEVGEVVGSLRRALDALHRDIPAMPVMTALLRHHRLLSATAVPLANEAGDDGLARRFADRAGAYARLVAAADNVSGNLGGGRVALAETARATTHLGRVVAASGDELQGLAGVLDATDASLATLLRRGAADRIYLVTNGKHIATHLVKGIRPAVPTYEPITAVSHPTFLRLARDLAPFLELPGRDHNAAASREAFTALLASSFGRHGVVAVAPSAGAGGRPVRGFAAAPGVASLMAPAMTAPNATDPAALGLPGSDITEDLPRDDGLAL